RHGHPLAGSRTRLEHPRRTAGGIDDVEVAAPPLHAEEHDATVARQRTGDRLGRRGPVMGAKGPDRPTDPGGRHDQGHHPGPYALVALPSVPATMERIQGERT